MKKLYTLLTCIFAIECAPTSEKTFYDQKQTGAANVQVHLKDLQIIAFVGDDPLGDYDYEYDYSELTIRPPHNVTLKPPAEASNSSTSSTPQTTSPPSSTPTPAIVTTSSISKIPSSTTQTPVAQSFSTISSPDRIKVQIIEDPLPTIAVLPAGVTNKPLTLGEVVHYKRCATGYARDKRGRCRRVRRPTHQFDIGKLASDLAARIRRPDSIEDTLER